MIFVHKRINSLMSRILIVSDQCIMRLGLSEFIKRNFPAITITEAAYEGTSRLPAGEDFHLVIVDVWDDLGESLALVHNIVENYPSSPVLAYSIKTQERFAKKFLEIGASGFVMKTDSEGELKSAMENLMNGKRYVTNSFLFSLVNSVGDANAQNPFNALSEREFDLVPKLLNGISVRQIAVDSGVASSTISTYKRRIFNKLKCKNLMELHSLAKVYKIV